MKNKFRKFVEYVKKRGQKLREEDFSRKKFQEVRVRFKSLRLIQTRIQARRRERGFGGRNRLT